MFSSRRDFNNELDSQYRFHWISNGRPIGNFVPIANCVRFLETIRCYRNCIIHRIRAICTLKPIANSDRVKLVAH